MTDAATYKNQGNAAFQAGRFEEAVELFTKAIEINPNDHVFFSNRSGAYASLKNYGKALEDADACVKINPSWPKGYQRKGLAHYFLGEIDQAVQAYEAGLKLDPNNSALKEGLEQAQSSQRSEPDLNEMLKNPQALQMMMKLMTNPETQGFMNDPSFMQSVQVLMKNPAMFAAMAQQDPRLKKAFEVISAPAGPEEEQFKNLFKNAGGAKPESNFTPPPPPPPKEETKPPKPEPKKEEAPVSPAEDFKNKGNAQYTKKNFLKAVEFYDQAIQLEPNEVLYHNNKAAAYIELGDLESAEAAVGKALQLIEDGLCKEFVKRGKIYARKASILVKQNQLTEAIKFYEKSMVEDARPAIKEELNRAKKQLKEQEIKAYINPEIAEKECEEGNALFKDGKFPDAVKKYEEAIKRNPNVAKYPTNLAIALIKLMDFVRARDRLEDALKIDPKYVKAYAKKGDCHFFLKEYHKALDMYEKGLKLDPSNEACTVGLEKTQMAIYAGSGNSADAEERARHAMADPEIQGILQSPEIRTVLNDLQNDPKAAAKAFQNPDIAAKLNKLIASGILKMG